MNTNFTYQVPTKVYFGDNQLGNLGEELKRYGKRVLLIYGGGSIKRTGLYGNIIKEINKAGLELFELSGIEPNPRHTAVNAGADICKKENIDVLLAVGGGSVLDSAKFISPAAFYEGDAWDFFTGKVQMAKFLPIISVLTLSGTGSEMDPFGIISNVETDEKIPLSHPALFPKASFLDPTTTYTLNKYQTACGGIDAFSHFLEVYFMKPNLHLLESLNESFMKTILKYLPIALESPEDYDARANLMWASSWALSGLTFGAANQPFMCHYIEDELSAKYDITHGLGLAIILPRYLEYCLNDENAYIYYQFGCNVFGIDAKLPKIEVAKKSIEFLKTFFFDTCGLQSTFSKIGIKDDSKFDQMAEIACRGGVLHGFADLNKQDIINIYNMCL